MVHYWVFKVISHLFITYLLEEKKTSQGIRENLTAHFSNLAWWFRDWLKKETQIAKCP